MLPINPVIFTSNLLITQQYCYLQLTNDTDKATIFRSFNPYIQVERFFEFRKHYYDFVIEEDVQTITQAHWTIDPFDNPNIIAKMFHDQLVHKEACLGGISPPGEKYHGDIVISSINESVLDGASEVQSFGLFDIYDIPPIDTWFYLMNTDGGKRLLFAWIPEGYIHYANNAVEVNCMDCIGWFKDWYPEEYKQYYLLAQ
ncbi:hypothetical protein A4D02_10535 [Niastella koreensis]|uniref:Uncharacterized protein n=2 Tax=Niastella koreensis TaxID=354356 RepID=G8TR71_NIAKG|nr:hypothetical protein [Niastella koreensis]AEV98985.1 hypothetical protein Niako_2646 [Niastella koreensis GR20-10]OQP43906.1 hypothetical protein A4D02_10535 [Niastella koreensis]